MKPFALLVAVALLSLVGYGQHVRSGKMAKSGEIPVLLNQLTPHLSDHQRAAILQDLGYGYLYKNGEIFNDLDSGMYYTRQLTTLARQMGSVRLQQEALLLTALLHMEHGDFPSSEKVLPDMDDTTRLETLLHLTEFCNNAAEAASPEDRRKLDLGARYIEAALPLSIKTRHFQRWTANCLENMAAGYRSRHLISLAEKYYLLTLQCTDADGYPPRARVYSNLSIVFTTEGNFYKAMDYGIRAEKTLTAESSDLDRAFVYNCLGGLSAVQERPESVLYYYGKLLDDPLRYRDHLQFYGAVATYCANLQKLNRVNEVLPFLRKMQQLTPPASNIDHYFANLAEGRCFRELREFEKSEKCFLDGIRYAEAGRISTGAINYHLGLLYYQFDQFEKAVATFRLAERKMSVENSPLIAMNNLSLAKAEAALGNHGDAYHFLLKSKTLSDSIFTVGKARLTDELETQYQAQKKEADLRLKEKNIEALNVDAATMRHDAQLKDAALIEAELVRERNEIELQRNEIKLQLNQKDVEVLKRDKALQQTIIDQAEARKSVTLIIIGLMAAIVALLCWLFWSKLRSNKVISGKNEQLQQLVNDKSWLLKEMHHRVKNNLQTIVSLLESQSAHLRDDALDAIQHSQARIFAMSLIHQKLYQTEDTRTIDMAAYIPELVLHLKDSFSISPDVRILMDIDPTAFNVEEAVPLGLIINEAVTNSMKYAFRSKQPGTICINLKAVSEDEYELNLSDNGIGLSKDFDFKEAATLGFQLIKGLSEQLRATLSIVNGRGLRITLTGISTYGSHRVVAMEEQLPLQ